MYTVFWYWYKLFKGAV